MAEERKFVFVNLGTTTLSLALDDSQTDVAVVAGDELPTLAAEEIASLVLRDDANDKYEVMYMTARTDNSLTVERGAEDTTPAEWPVGTVVRNSLTAGFFEKLASLPATRFRTSKPYPHVLIESMDMGGTLDRESPNLSPHYLGSDGDNDIEAMDILGTLVSGEFDVLLISYAIDPVEELDIDAVLVSGELTPVTIHAYAIDPIESMDMNGVLLSGVLDAVLVSYTLQTESMNVGGSLQSGVMA